MRDESSFDAILERLSSLEKEKTIAYQRIKDSETQIAALKNEIDVLKENAVATERYIEGLAEDVEATTEFLALGVRLFSCLPPSLLLLPFYQGRGQSRSNQTQKPARPCSSMLAKSLGLSTGTSNNISASRDFREALGPSSSLQVCWQRFLDLLREHVNAIPTDVALLESNPAALNLLADRSPKIRQHGDQVAHGHRQ